MGTNKRYAAHYDRLMDERVNEMITRSGPLQSLSKAELDLEREPLTRAPVARPVRAWVRYGSAPLEVDAELVAWTARACAVRWRIGETDYRAWVWSSAVTVRAVE